MDKAWKDLASLSALRSEQVSSCRRRESCRVRPLSCCDAPTLTLTVCAALSIPTAADLDARSFDLISATQASAASTLMDTSVRHFRHVSN